MQSIFNLVKNIKNLLPYFILIAIYFFFINLEARKDKDNFRYSEKDKKESLKQSKDDETNIRIEIPVIPYKQ